MIYLTSDTHYFHTNIIKHGERPFADVTEMNEALVNNFNSVVKQEDEVYFLGDFSMNTNGLVIVKKLSGLIYLLPGNHDKCFPWNGKAQLADRRKRYYDAGFKKILERETTMQIGDESVILNHFPYREDNPEYTQKYAEYRPVDKGGWLIHGHCHQSWLKKGRMINVSCEPWNYFPVSLDQILQVMNDPRDFILNVDELNTKVL